MEKYNNQYLRLLENTKSEDNVFEDKDERIKRREERRRERQENKFAGDNKEKEAEDSYDDESAESDTNDKFKIKPFQKAVEGIKNETISQLRDCDMQIKMNGAGKKSAEEFKPKFYAILQRSAKLLGEIAYRREKEGRKLESSDPNDAKLIKAYRETYKSLLDDITSTSEGYNSKSADSVQQYYEDQKYSDISGKVAEAEKIFDKAKKILSDSFTDIGIEIMNAGGASSPQGGTATSGASGGTGSGADASFTAKPVVKIESPIKKGVGSKAKPNEKVQTVQSLIMERFKNNKEITKTNEWKVFSKYGADGAFGSGTGNLIKLIKKTLGIKDLTSDITQELVDGISSMKESKNHKLLSFNDFLKRG